MTDQDGNIYKTIIIGTQTWMAENLRVTRYRNGDPIPNVSDNASWVVLTNGAICNFDNTVDSDKIATYGRLYNWYAVNDSRNITPTGWHTPTDAEWALLSTYLGGDLVSGGKMKETGITHWIDPNTGATNESGFSATPLGYRGYSGGGFYDLGNTGNYWTSVQNGNAYAYARIINYNDAKCDLGFYGKAGGFAVRLVKD